MSATQAALQQAQQHRAAGDAAKARQVLLKAAQRSPRDPLLLYHLVEVLLALRDDAAADYWSEQLLRAAPNAPASCFARSHAALAVGKTKEASEACRRWEQIEPRSLDAKRALAWVLHIERRYLETLEAVDRGLALAPDDADFWRKRAVAMLGLGRGADAERVYRDGLARNPASIDLAEGVCVCDNYLSGADPHRTLRDHQRFGELLTAAQPARPCAAPPRAIPADQPVRVGLLSPDLRRHSCALFAEAILRHHDPREIELFVYFTYEKEDHVSARLKAMLPEVSFAGAVHRRWRTLDGSQPDTVESAIRGDRLDLLIELSGLTRDHNLAVVARKPAPVIATYLGYPNTTGLKAVDFRLVDGITDPPPPAIADELCTERLIRLDPCFLCFTPPPDVPPVRWDREHAPPVFGSFNNLMKTTDDLLRLWAGLLERVPGARLVLKTAALGDGDVRADLLKRAAAAGIDTSRLDLLRPLPDLNDHLAAYDQVDIALETFPYHGTTTTCEALSMGVPYVTIEGSVHAARVGCSLLRAAGLPELIAPTPEAAMDLAATLAVDRPRVAQYRRTIRGRLLASPLCDGPAFIRRFTAAVRRMVNTGVTG